MALIDIYRKYMYGQAPEDMGLLEDKEEQKAQKVLLVLVEKWVVDY